MPSARRSNRSHSRSRHRRARNVKAGGRARAKWERRESHGTIPKIVNISSQSSRSRSDRGHGERGFTLLELLIVITIIPIIVGAISGGLITILNLQSSVQNRITDSGDAQTTSSTF